MTALTPYLWLTHRIAQGGMGTVWAAQHTRLGATVAVKLVRPECGLARDYLHARLQREARVTASIASPHVVRVLDHDRDEHGRPFMTMERLQGETLKSHVSRRGPLSADDVAALVSQVASALDQAHRRGIVHRDVKPANIFLAGPSPLLFAKLLDFGIAKHDDDAQHPELTCEGEMLGTPRFISPEQIFKSHAVDGRADLWSLAAVAYYALSGAYPYPDKALFKAICAIRDGKMTPISHFVPNASLALDDWFRRAFHPRIEERFQTVQDLAYSFATAVQPVSTIQKTIRMRCIS